MAKLLKHLGFGAKKAPPQPPKPDYSGLKSASTEYSLARSPTNERSTGSLPAGTSHIGEADGAQLQGSPHRVAAGTAEKGSTSYGGARPKDTGGGGVSPKGASVDRVSMPSVSSIDDPEGPATGEQERQEGAVGSGPSATPPRLLDEYSDPLDLKKQILEENMLGALAAPIAEDDYSVPYEVKKLFKEMGLREGIDQNTPVRMRGRNPRLYDDPYDEGGAGAIAPSAGPPGPGESGDRRPKEDYDEPWEWNKQSLLLKTELASGGHNLPPHFMTKQTPQAHTPLVKRTVETKPAAAAAENEEEEEEEGEPDFLETVDTEQEQPTEGEKETTEEAAAETSKEEPTEEKSEEKEPKKKKVPTATLR